MRKSDQVESIHYEQVARTDVTVLIGGETGSGKGRMAKRIHAMSHRATKPFIPADCAALPDALFESQLFGYKKGAFTGASEDRQGLIRAAEGGTLFLDEVGELSLEQQAKLLVFIQERSILPVGDSKRVECDIRLIAATHRDLPSMVEQGEFREDLFFRLAVIEMTMPSLRDRLEELPEIIEDLIASKATLLHVEPKSMTNEYYAYLRAYDWPGNIRELGNVIERSLVLSKGQYLQTHTLPRRVLQTLDQPTGEPGSALTPQQLRDALRQHGGNKAATARTLGVSRRHLYRIISRLDMCTARTEPVYQ